MVNATTRQSGPPLHASRRDVTVIDSPKPPVRVLDPAVSGASGSATVVVGTTVVLVLVDATVVEVTVVEMVVDVVVAGVVAAGTTVVVSVTVAAIVVGASDGSGDATTSGSSTVVATATLTPGSWSRPIRNESRAVRSPKMATNRTPQVHTGTPTARRAHRALDPGPASRTGMRFGETSGGLSPTAANLAPRRGPPGDRLVRPPGSRRAQP
jgi:hypothetical protein